MSNDLFTKVMQEIQKFHGMDVMNISAKVNEGHVTLQGNTGAVHIVDKLVAAVEAVPGVTGVTNEIVAGGGE